jgi:hypothetical protein
MRKILTLLLALSALITTTGVKAQSFCAGITVETFALNPQSGAHNYFGIRIKLDMAYDQNVTVSGYLYYLDHYNTDHPFSLTITAGNTSVETSSTYFEMSPAIDDVETTISASPSTLTANGVSFGTSCASTSPLDRLEMVGQLHNDYMDYVLGYIQSQNLDFSDSSTISSAIYTKSNTFLGNNGFPSTTAYVHFEDPTLLTSIGYNPSNYSTAAASILYDLNALVDNYDPANDDSYYGSLVSLQTSALNLSDPIEVYAVGIPVTVAMYSHLYWKNNGQYWADTFCAQDSIRRSTARIMNGIPYPNTAGLQSNAIGVESPGLNIFRQAKTDEYFHTDRIQAMFNKFEFNGKSARRADIAGAISGAWEGAKWGAVGGAAFGALGGALAGGVMGGSMASIGDIADQLMSHFFSWW